MNFVAQVEEQLRDLGTEARRKLPGVKEASERAILQLRGLQSKYVASVRLATSTKSPHPTTRTFQSQDILRPFLLAANYPDAGHDVIQLALNAIHTLIAGDAVCPEDTVHVVRVLTIQANVCCAALRDALGRGGGSSGSGNGSSSSTSMLNSAGGSAMSSLGTSILTGFGMLGGDSSAGGGKSNRSSSEDHSRKGKSGNGSGYSSSMGRLGIHSHRTLKQDEAIAIRILQTLTMIVDSNSLILSQEIVSQCLAISLVLISKGVGDYSCSAMGGSSHSHDGTGATRDNNKSESNAYLKAIGGFGAIVGGNTGSGSLGSVLNVQRIAIATLRRTISIIFDKAGNAVHSSEYKDDNDRESLIIGVVTNQSVMRTLAYSILMDLVALAGSKSRADFENISDNEKDNSNPDSIGPFVQACRGIGIGHQRLLPPPRKMCFDLLDMILQQNSTLFTSEASIQGSCDFPSLLPQALCPLISDTLATEFIVGLNHDDVTEKDAKISGTDEDERSISLLLILLKISFTLVTYVKHPSYADSMNSECHLIMICLVKFIKAATEVYRDANDFEDGFVYSEDSEFHETKKASGNHSHKRMNKQERKSQPLSHIDWRAAIALEFFYNLIESHFEELSCLFQFNDSKKASENLLAFMMESICEFAIVKTRSSAGICGVVSISRAYNVPISDKEKETRGKTTPKVEDFSHKKDKRKSLSDMYENDLETLQPTLTALARTPVKGVENWDGLSVWVAFHIVLSLWKSLFAIADPGKKQSNVDNKALIDGSFASSLALLQHFLTRFPAAGEVYRRVLSGYFNLTRTSLPWCEDNDVQCRAIITSLCKLALPSSGENDVSSLIQDHHIAIMSLIVQIIHFNYDLMRKEWFVILSTFEQLSKVPISSSKLSDDGSLAAASIAKGLCRLGAFTTCISPGQLNYFISSLIEMSTTLNFNDSNSMQLDHSIATSEMTSKNKIHRVGKKIKALAGRAVSNGPGEKSQQDQELSTEDSRLEKGSQTRCFGHDYCEHVYNKFGITKLVTAESDVLALSFIDLLLADFLIENTCRFIPFGQTVTAHLCSIAANSDSRLARFFAMDTLSCIACTAFHNSNDKEYFGRITLPLQGVKHIDECFRKEIITQSSGEAEGSSVSLFDIEHDKLLHPLCKSITVTENRDTAEAGLKHLQVILESAGHNITSEGWLVIIEGISALSGSNIASPIDRSSSDWSSCCNMAFRCLKLIVDDFLDVFPGIDVPSKISSRRALLDCCAAFGSSRHDVNMSLTATGMLWTIADQNPSPSAVDHVLSKLALLASDTRVELRNCSVNTLFSCIVGLGQNFTSDQWKVCISGTIFGVLDQIARQGNSSECKEEVNLVDSQLAAKNSERYRLSVHHSRDSSSKQWATTQVLVLRGIERVLRQFFGNLLNTFYVSKDVNEEATTNISEWFISAWLRILYIAYECSTQVGGRESLDVRIAGIDVIILCLQVSSESGLVASSNPARVGTNMQVVNGALRSVRSATVAQSEIIPISPKHHIDGGRRRLFQDAFNVLMNFHSYLSDDSKLAIERHEETSSTYMETALIQILTRFCQGLSKLYDSLQENEFEINGTVTTEKNFINLVAVCMAAGRGGAGTKYLTQVQRICLELLQNMVSRSSSKALETLAEIGGYAFFWQPFDDKSKGSGHLPEVLELEAAKLVSDSYIKNNGIPHEAQIKVMCSILELFFVHSACENLVTRDTEPQYKLMLSVVRGGLDSTNKIGKQEEKKDDANLLIENAWSKVFRFMTIVVNMKGLDSKYFAPNTHEIQGLISACVELAPHNKHAELGEVLSTFVSESLFVAKTLDETDNFSDAGLHMNEALDVFKMSFSGLCSVLSDRDSLLSIADPILDKAISATLVKEDEKAETSIDIKVATLLCGELLGISNISEIAFKLTYRLLKLINSDDASLRHNISALLQTLDFVNIAEREGEAERLGSEAESSLDELQHTKQELEASKKSVLELELVIAELSKDKERLEQQVAVLSEGSAYM